MKITILIAFVLQFISYCLAKYVMNEKNEMIQVFEVEVFSSVQPKPQIFLFDAKAVKIAHLKEKKLVIKDNEFVEDNELGLYLGKTSNSKVLDPIHHQYLRNEEYRVWLPYSHCGEWKPIFNSNGTSTIINQLRRTSSSRTQYPLITIRFKYDPDWEIINQNELNLIVNWLNANTNKRNSIKTLLKMNIIQSATNYTIISKSLQDTNVKNSNSKQAITNLETTLKTEESKIKELEKTLTDLNNKLAVAADLTQQNLIIQKKLTDEEGLHILEINREKKKRSQLKPPSPAALKNEINSIVSLIHLPDQLPDEFRDEHNLKDDNSMRKAYDSCVTLLSRVDECKNDLTSYGLSKQNPKRLLKK